MAEQPAADLARRWIELYNDGSPDSYGSGRFFELYSDDVDWREMPTSWHPEGRTGSLADLRKSLAEAQFALRNRRAHLHEIIADGDRAAMNYLWEARVAIDGLPVPRGAVLRSEIAQFITVSGGKIVRSREYVIALPPG